MIVIRIWQALQAEITDPNRDRIASTMLIGYVGCVTFILILDILSGLAI